MASLRRGQATEAIASASADGRWSAAANADALRLGLSEDWAADPGTPGTSKLMIATTVAEVEWLNRAAREVLISAGRLGPESITVALTAPDRAVESRELRVGDVVRATRNDEALGVFTGSVGTVVGLDPARREVTVALEVGRAPARTVVLGPEFLEERSTLSSEGRRRIDAPGLAHASTAHRVQGRTALSAYVLVTKAGMLRQAIYVASSRAAEATHYYGMTLPEGDEIERVDGRAVPGPDPDDAAEVGRLMGRPPAWLWAEHQSVAARVGTRPPMAESLRRVRGELASAYAIAAEAPRRHRIEEDGAEVVVGPIGLGHRHVVEGLQGHGVEAAAPGDLGGPAQPLIGNVDDGQVTASASIDFPS